MARFRYLCSTFSLCVCVLMFLGICSAILDTDYYFYQIGQPRHRSEHSIFLNYDEMHTYQKRDVEMESPHFATVTPPPVNTSEKVTPLLKPVKPSKQKLADTQKSTDSLNFVTKVRTAQNVGVNGTGQRKNITLLREHPALIHNITASVNTPVNVTNDDEDEFGADDIDTDRMDIDEEELQKTLIENNITSTKTDTHIFYNSTTYTDPVIGQSYWVELENRTDVKVNDLLSSSHRRAATIKLSFEFPFYGHLIKNVTIATGGFLYTGNYVHSWLAATQYIAPLMANFDTGLSNDSYIKFVDNGTAFTVEWDRVLLQDKPKEGEFTFQVTLHKTGNIVFVYKNVPLLIKSIEDIHHPVKVGLSDAYIMDQTIFFVRRKTIYEYHRVAFQKEEVKNWTAIYLKALPTCLSFNNCTQCVASNMPKDFQCRWCPKNNQCSNGFDRNRQEWVIHGCEKKNFSLETQCLIQPNTKNKGNMFNFDETVIDPTKDSSAYDDDYLGKVPPQQEVGVSGFVAIIFLMVMISGLGIWMLYAYRNPHTTSGQILIRYRPSQWRWRRGEARYTAATIHM